MPMVKLPSDQNYQVTKLIWRGIGLCFSLSGSFGDTGIWIHTVTSLQADELLSKI